MRSDIELLRIISALGIVWFHSRYELGRSISYAGLIVFVIFSAYFSIMSEKRHSVKDRSLRLLLPCVLWSAFYAGISIVRGQDIYPNDYSLVSKILGTPSIHLWYLPFAFVFIIVIDHIRKYVDPAILAISSTVLASTLLLTSSEWREWSLITPFGQYMHAAPAIFVGVLIALSKKINKSLQLFLLALIFISTLYTFLLKIEGVGVTYFVGIIASLLLLREKSLLPRSNPILVVSKLSFGIYLVHPIFILILGHIGFSSISLPILSFVISALFVYLSVKIIPKPISKYLF